MSSTFALIFLNIVLILIVPNTFIRFLKCCTLFFNFLIFFIFLLLLFLFKKTNFNFQFSYDMPWFDFFNIFFFFGVDGVSLVFILLVTLLIPICLLSSWENINYLQKEYLIAFLVLELILILAFSVKDLLLFYIFFESSLVPMFILIGVWGSRTRRVRASYLLFFYTFWGSVLLLLSIIVLYLSIGSTNYDLIISHQLEFSIQIFLWPAFFIAFASKVPMLPFHLWLPEAHVEASTAGSVVLAGILLKLGVYGFFRFVLQICPDACLWFAPLVYTISCAGVLYTSLTAIRQTDLKRIIAYTSVAHMNLVMVGIFSFNIEGLEGAIFQSLCHGFVSSALFLLIGVLYDRYRTRLVKYYSGIVHTMPLFSIFFMFFTMSNIALPSTGSFIGEFLILVGIFKTNIVTCFVAATGMIWGGAYSLWLYNRIVFGNLKIQFLVLFTDTNKREFVCVLPLLVCTLLFGLFPSIFLKFIHFNVEMSIASSFCF